MIHPTLASRILSLAAVLVLAPVASSAQESVTVPVQIQGAAPDSESIDMLVFEGELYLEEGRFRDAAITFTQVTEFAPDRLDGHLYLARSLTGALLAGQIRDVRSAAVEALKQYRWVLAREPNHPEALRGVQLLSDKYFDGLSVPLQTDAGRRHWAAGEAAMRAENFADAVQSFRAAAEAEPGVPDAHRALGDALLGSDDPKAAAASYRACLELNPDDANALEGLGLALERLKDTEGALDAYAAAFSLAPDSEPTQEGLLRLLGGLDPKQLTHEQALLLGRAQVEQEDYKAGAATLARALEGREDRNPEAVKALGVARYFLDSLPQAEALFREAHTAVPGDREALYYLAASVLRQGRAEEGMQYLRAMLESDPNNPNALRLLGLTLADAPGREDEAAAVLERARRAGAVVENLPCILGTLYMRLARHDEAYQEFQDCLEINPEFPGTHLALGIIADEQGRRGESIVHLEQYMQSTKNPEPGAAFRLGVAYLRVGRDADAYRVIRSVVLTTMETDEEVTDTQLLEMTSFFLSSVRRYDDSIFVGEMLLTRDTDNAVYNNNLAMAYADAGQKPERALQLAERATALDPDNPGHLDTLGWALVQTRDYARAEEVLKRSVALASAAGRDDLSEIYYHLGILYRATNRLEDAEHYFNRAMENPPTPYLKSEIQRNLRELAEPPDASQ